MTLDQIFKRNGLIPTLGTKVSGATILKFVVKLRAQKHWTGF